MSNIFEKINLLKKCELCHKNMATKRIVTLANKKIWICEKCYKLVKF
ncbi:hypothetical protein [Clostridium sp. C2-6-12]|nr:hypothetical protein [Clostridium sp. C2-6-12]